MLAGTQALAMTYQEAMKSTTPMVLYMYLETCGTCKHFNPMFSAARNKFSYKYNFVKEDINSKAMDPLSTAWGVNGVPALFIIDPKLNNAYRVPFNCLIEEECLNKTLKNYKRQR